MRKNGAGFILLMTLLMISMISLLLLTSMQHLLLYYNAINQLQKTHQRFYQLESWAMTLAGKKLEVPDKSCVVEEKAANKTIQRLVHHQGCALEVDSNYYRYLIEDLGDYPCLVALEENKIVSTHHKRISVLAIEDNGLDSVLQVRVITPIMAKDCNTQKHFVPLGVSSWRYLVDF